MIGTTESVVLATMTGKVFVSGYNGTDGHYITLIHSGGWRSRYCHLSRRFVREGATVQAGQTIGRVGDTGLTDGEHLHFELWQYGRAVDPLDVLGISHDKMGRF
jgi:murein DD-endopeptidase MepM/ murein hydrolase activator NlpD